MESASKTQQETCKLKGEFKKEIENLVHKHIMEELEFMVKHKITHFVRR